MGNGCGFLDKVFAFCKTNFNPEFSIDQPHEWVDRIRLN